MTHSIHAPRTLATLLAVALLLSMVGSPSALAVDVEHDQPPRANRPRSPDDSILDPARYLRITWDGRPIHSPGDPAQRWEVVGRRGNLRIEMIPKVMKRAWGFDSRGELSIRGYVVSEEGRRAIEIPGYSVVGKTLEVRTLDLSVASDLVAQIIQGSRLAHEILRVEEQAELAGLEAEGKALEQLLAAEKRLHEEVERALREVYTKALLYRLDDRDLKRVTGLILAAEERRDRFRDFEAIGRRAELDSFFDDLGVRRDTIDTWLEVLLSDANRPYMPILGEIADRDPQLIVANARSMQNLLENYDTEKLTVAGLNSVRERLIGIAEVLIDIEHGIFYRYRQGGGFRTAIEEAPQFIESKPAGFEFKEIRTVERRVKAELQRCSRVACRSGNGSCSPATEAGSEEGTAASEPCPGGVDGGSTEVNAETRERAEGRAEARVRALKSLFEALAGTERFDELEAEVTERFAEQIEEWIESRRRIACALRAKRSEIRSRVCSICRGEKAFERALRGIKVQSEYVEAALMTEITHRLIDQVVPANLNLDGLDLDRGDRLEIVVSLLPGTPPPPQYTASYLVTDFGWEGPKPEVENLLTFVRPAEGGGELAPRPGVAALWHWHGSSEKRNGWARVLAPGIGFGANFLNADDDEETIEVGLGVTLTLFNDLLHVTYGRNLQQLFNDGEDDETHEYLGVGISLGKVLEKFDTGDD